MSFPSRFWNAIASIVLASDTPAAMWRSSLALPRSGVDRAAVPALPEVMYTATPGGPRRHAPVPCNR